MPIYEYHCKDCEQIFEEWQKSHDAETAECPVCGGTSQRIISSTTFVLKGGGWYVSEYGKNSASSTSQTKSESPASKAASASSDSGTQASSNSA